MTHLMQGSNMTHGTFAHEALRKNRNGKIGLYYVPVLHVEHFISKESHLGAYGGRSQTP